MPTTYPVGGYVTLAGVTFNGTEGAPGSTLSWTGIAGEVGPGNVIADFDNDGLLDQGVDAFSNVTVPFTGYTIAAGGANYGVYYQSSTDTFFVPIAESGIGQSTIPSSGTSNAFQTQAHSYLCFAAGSLIATPDGECRVQDLKIGDLVRTQDGRSVPVKWLGHQNVMPSFNPADRLTLVRFAAGSLGNGLPHSDLTVTADHAMLVDGVLCNASALVNDATITRVPLDQMGETFTVYHIETEDHEIILANGSATETFIDNTSRRVFDNYTEYQALYGDEAEMQELPLPRATSARQVPSAVRARLRAEVAA